MKHQKTDFVQQTSSSDCVPTKQAKQSLPFKILIVTILYCTLKREKEQYKIKNMPQIYNHISNNTDVKQYINGNAVMPA